MDVSTRISSDDTTEVRVWDLLVRCGHWLLAVGFAVAYLTEDDLLTAHVWAGYSVGAIVCLRIAWGVVGSKHARFSDFLYSPRQAIGYMTDVFRGRARRYLGHSPAAAIMVYVLLVALLLTTVSGLIVYAYDKHAGPLAGVVSGQHVDATDGERHRVDDPAEEFWEEAHEVLANLTLALVVLHVVGVLLSSFAHRENLIRAMVTGRKRADH